MSVYYRENPDHFIKSVESMTNQTIAPDEIVIVKDGPLTKELDQEIKKLEKNKSIKIIEIEKNVGLGIALNIGLNHCTNEIVARMDTDDISEKNRCERQLTFLNDNPSISLVGTTIAEFFEDSEQIKSYRIVPKEDNEIKEYMKTRSPFNHPSVMFKKSAVIGAGGYLNYPLNEDYYLWVRMLISGCKFANIDEPLLKMRITKNTFERRGGWKYFITQKKLFDFMLTNKIINKKEYIYNNLIRFITRLLLPNDIRGYLYRKVLRKKSIQAN